jgi:hypothetical protein
MAASALHTPAANLAGNGRGMAPGASVLVSLISVPFGRIKNLWHPKTLRVLERYARWRDNQVSAGPGTLQNSPFY